MISRLPRDFSECCGDQIVVVGQTGGAVILRCTKCMKLAIVPRQDARGNVNGEECVAASGTFGKKCGGK